MTAIGFLEMSLEERLYVVYQYSSFISVDYVDECTYHRLDDFYVVVQSDHAARRIKAILPFTSGVYYERMVNWATRRSYS